METVPQERGKGETIRRFPSIARALLGRQSIIGIRRRSKCHECSQGPLRQVLLGAPGAGQDSTDPGGVGADSGTPGGEWEHGRGRGTGAGHRVLGRWWVFVCTCWNALAPSLRATSFRSLLLLPSFPSFLHCMYKKREGGGGRGYVAHRLKLWSLSPGRPWVRSAGSVAG